MQKIWARFDSYCKNAYEIKTGSACKTSIHAFIHFLYPFNPIQLHTLFRKGSQVYPNMSKPPNTLSFSLRNVLLEIKHDNYEGVINHTDKIYKLLCVKLKQKQLRTRQTHTVQQLLNLSVSKRKGKTTVWSKSFCSFGRFLNRRRCVIKWTRMQGFSCLKKDK